MFGQGIRHFRAIQACGGASGGLSYLGGGSADQRLISFLAASTQSNVLSSSQHRVICFLFLLAYNFSSIAFIYQLTYTTTH